MRGERQFFAVDHDHTLRKHDRAAVVAALQTSDYEAIATSSQSALDELVHWAIELGVFEALKLIRVQRDRGCDR
jgi:hypothetical protein